MLIEDRSADSSAIGSVWREFQTGRDFRVLRQESNGDYLLTDGAQIVAECASCLHFWYEAQKGQN